MVGSGLLQKLDLGHLARHPAVAAHGGQPLTQPGLGDLAPFGGDTAALVESVDDVATLSFAKTGAWSTWKTLMSTVNLAAGHNVVRLATTGTNGPNIDSLTVGTRTGGSTTPTMPIKFLPAG